MNIAPLRIASIAIVLLAIGCGSEDSEKKVATAGSCEESYSACGGDVTGAWNLGNLCVTGSVTNALNGQLAEYPSCSTAFTDGNLESDVSVTYTATDFTRSGTNHLTGKMKISDACFSEMTSGTPLSALSCGSFAQVLPNIMISRCAANNLSCSVAVDCGYADSTCNCNTDTTEQVNVSGTYTVSDTTLTESTGATYQYCVKGSQLTQSGQVGDGIAGIVFLNK